MPPEPVVESVGVVAAAPVESQLADQATRFGGRPSVRGEEMRQLVVAGADATEARMAFGVGRTGS